MEKVIVAIHGLANKPPRDELTVGWRQAIVEGLKKNAGVDDPGFRFEMVYWADLMYKYPMHRDANFCADSLYNKEPYYPVADPDVLKEYKDGFIDNVRNGLFDIVGDTLDVFKQKLGVDALADWMLGRLLKDLNYYYADRRIRGRDGEQGATKQILRKDLLDVLKPLQGNKILLIAHSMGSIIAYDALRDLGRETPDFGLDTLVTIGSPLGVPHVKAKIIEERNYHAAEKDAARVRTPTVVTGAWLNFADRKDPVAVDAHLADDYHENANGVRVKDDLVSNDYIGPEVGKPNHHKSYGYLRTPEFSHQVAEFLK